MSSTILQGVNVDRKTALGTVRARPHRAASLPYHHDMAIGPCLLVSRQLGSGGDEIAKRVAQRLGWTHLDKEIVDLLASQYGTPRVVLDTVDEKQVGWVTDLLNGWIEGHGFSQLAYVNRLGRLFNMAAMRGNVVIVGRGAKFLLPQTAGFSVRIIAPTDFRMEQVVLRQGISAAQARTLIERSDADRKAFTERYFHQDVTDPQVHDLVINIKQVTPDYAVHLIHDAVHFWLKRSGFEPRQHVMAS